MTVVIPTRDRRRLLMRTLTSVLAQVDVPLHVLVVDDGSTDGTADAVDALHSPAVSLVRHEQSLGVSRARNSGLADADTPFVAFTDDDDLWAPTKLRDQLAGLDSFPAARWSCTDAVHIDGRLHVITYAEAPPSGDVAAVMTRRMAVPGGGSGVLVRTSLARCVGGFDPDFSILADWDFYLRLALCSPVAAVHAPLVGYYVHADSMYHDPLGLADELDRLRQKYSHPVPLCSGSRIRRVQFSPDLPRWYVRSAAMAYAQGDVRAALRILRDGARSAGGWSIAGRLLGRIVRRAGRRLGTAPDEGAPARWVPFEKWPHV
ncbi:glycosyltransferase family 2 protein [Geodermatophilus telluris]|nr:glycosyltransferase family A protein [Geodermatophilus telluris]